MRSAISSFGWRSRWTSKNERANLAPGMFSSGSMVVAAAWIPEGQWLDLGDRLELDTGRVRSGIRFTRARWSSHEVSWRDRRKG